MNIEIQPLKPFGVCLTPTSPAIKIHDIEMNILRDLFNQSHLILLRNFTTFQDANEFATYCDKWGEVSLWPFGKVLELVEHEKPEDHIFDHSYVPLHWDGMYRPEVPEYQIFHCVKAPLEGQGGRTIFSNTDLVLKNIAEETKKLWQNVTGTYQRAMSFYDSKVISPIITQHPHKHYHVIRYNEPHSEAKGQFVNPPNLTFDGIEKSALNDFHQSLQQALYDENHVYHHHWQDGDVVIADNFTLLHGREKFTQHSPRHLRRVQVLSDPPYHNTDLVSYQ